MKAPGAGVAENVALSGTVLPVLHSVPTVQNDEPMVALTAVVARTGTDTFIAVWFSDSWGERWPMKKKLVSGVVAPAFGASVSSRVPAFHCGVTGQFAAARGSSNACAPRNARRVQIGCTLPSSTGVTPAGSVSTPRQKSAAHVKYCVNCMWMPT